MPQSRFEIGKKNKFSTINPNLTSSKKYEYLGYAVLGLSVLQLAIFVSLLGWIALSGGAAISHPLMGTFVTAGFALVASNILGIGIYAAMHITKKSLFGAEKIILSDRIGGIHLDVARKNGILQYLGYNDPYQKMSVDNALEQVRAMPYIRKVDELARLENLVAKLEKEKTKARRGKATPKQIAYDAALASQEKCKAILLSQMTTRTQAALQQNSALFPQSEQDKITDTNYIKNKLKSQFRL